MSAKGRPYRDRMGDDYEPDASPPWARVVEEWEVFKILVHALDNAVSEPFARESAKVLTVVSRVLHADDVMMMCAAIEAVGHALAFGAAFPGGPAREGQS